MTLHHPHAPEEFCSCNPNVVPYRYVRKAHVRSPFQMARELAAGLVEKGEFKTQEQAIAEVFKRDPELYRRSRAEQRVSPSPTAKASATVAADALVTIMKLRAERLRKPGQSEAQAFVEYISTAEGRELYAQHSARRRAAGRLPAA